MAAVVDLRGLARRCRDVRAEPYRLGRSGYRTDIGLLELLRLALVMLVAVLFNQPEWVEEYRPDEKPTIAVLWDGSTSMDTRDVSGADGRADVGLVTPRSGAAAHRRYVLEFAARAAWPSKYRPSRRKETATGHEPLSAPHVRDRKISQPARYRAGLGRRLERGTAPRAGRPVLRLQEVPVFVVPVGSPSRLPDVELLSLDAPTFGIVGKSVRIPFTIESTLPREQLAIVTLKTSDGDQLTKEVRIAPMARTSDWLIWKPPAVGDYTLSLDVPPSPRNYWPTIITWRRRFRSAKKSCACCWSNRSPAGNTVTCGTPCRVIRVSSFPVYYFIPD